MKILKPSEVQAPNILDPEWLDALTTPIPDFYVPVDHPQKPGEVFHIPCRELSPGESLVFIFTVREKYPEMPEKKFEDLPDEEQKNFVENQKKIDVLDNEMFIEVALCCFLQENWTRERVERLPKSVRRAAYEGATAGLNAIDPVVDTFSETDREGGSENEGDMSRRDVDESERRGTASEEPISESAKQTPDMAN